MAGTTAYLGIDVGSTAAKAVAVGLSGAILARALAPSGVDFGGVARTLADRVLAAAGVSGAAGTVATGLGRRNVGFADEFVTEIKCHARGAAETLKPPFTLIDIGGQDNKVIAVEADGRVGDFTMNRKCAAGTGAFLEEIGRRLGLGLEGLGKAAASARTEAALGSFCTVFASTEVLHLIRAGTPVQDIAAGALRSVVKRVLEMVSPGGRVALSGGVAAHFPRIASMLAEETGAEVTIAPEPQFTGALGAALIARGAAAAPARET